jgi:hypothetical protein
VTAKVFAFDTVVVVFVAAGCSLWPWTAAYGTVTGLEETTAVRAAAIKDSARNFILKDWETRAIESEMY